MPGPDGLVEVAVGGRDDAHVGGPGSRLAEPLELLVLQEAKQLGLDDGRNLADLVEEEGAALRGLHPSRLVPHRAGEGALGMPEHLAREQLFAERGAVHHREGPIPSRAHLVERAGEDALSGAALASQEKGDVVGRGPGDHLGGGAHRGALRLEVRLRHRVGEAVLQVQDPARHVSPRLRRLDCPLDLRRRERFRQVILRPELDGLDGGVERRVGGDHHHVEPRALGEESGEEREAVLASDAQVHERDVVRRPRDRLQRRSARARLGHLTAHALQAHRERLADVALVVDDEDASRLLRRHGPIIPANAIARKHRPTVRRPAMDARRSGRARG